MISFRRIPLCLLLVTALSLAAAASARGESIMSKNKVPGQVESKARRLMHDLKKQGFEVSRGYFKLWTADDCAYTISMLGSCLANNPAAPYIASVVPPWPEEFVDPADSSVWGPSIEGYNDVYRLDPHEAIVILGQLPPPAAYFSQQTYLFSRQGTFDTDSETYSEIYNGMPFLFPLLFEKLPLNTERFLSLSSLSNFNNNVVIERQSGAAFGQIRYFIITPDQDMDEAVREAFAHIGVEDQDIFTEPIPSDTRTGLDEGADDFTTTMRFAQPEDGQEAAAEKWRANLPLVVLRVRETRSDRQPQPYPPVVLEDRTAVNEWPLQPDLGSLLAAVAQRWGQPCTNADCSDLAGSFRDMQTDPANLVGPSCIPIGENCLGDNRDTIYQFFGPMSLDNGEIYAIAGTLGTETGNATYVGLGINRVSILKGVANLSDKDLGGTANAYAAEVNNTDKFYLYYFTRNCSGLEDLTDNNCFELPVTMIPQGDHFGISMRDYIKPGTQRGPDTALILPSMVLKLHGEPRDGEMTTAVLSIFEEISQIPRCSKNEAAISNWLVDWADQRGLPVTTDAFQNVLITVPASPGFKNRAPIVLQSHMDMVCQKEPDSPHDFTKDPIVLVRDGDWLGAEDTTLGADDGIGIAIALAIADNPSIEHPKLEILVTTDEEIDMTGAAGLSDTLLTGEKYINIDSETEGVITIGAAGGIKIDLSRPLAFSPLPADQTVFSLEIAGLLGGHSGLDINKGRANANYLAAQALAGIVPLRLIDFVGGSADNVITQSSAIRFAVSPADVGTLQTRIAQFEQEARAQYPSETGMTMTLTELSNTAQPAASEADSANAVSLIASLPQGVYEWSTDLPGQAETSDNIGIVMRESGALDATTFARSFDPTKLESIASLIEATAATYGASSTRRSAFPAWPPDTDSALYNTFLSSYQDLFGTPMTSEIVHAGLECGYIAEKYPDMQIVSIGPTLQDVHSTKERLYVPSLEKVVELLTDVMKRP